MMHRRRGARPQTKTAELRRWWLDRFELSEIQVMANHIFPRGTERGNALTAALRDMNR